MTDLSDLVVGMVALNHGTMVGKTRLQKSFYLLDMCGMDSGVDFDYHNFGPFSAEVAMATDDAVAAERLSSEDKQGYHAVPYTLYATDEKPSASLGELPADTAAEKLKVMEKYSALELEVAATIMFLRDAGYGKKAVQETQNRKPVKATESRVARALEPIGDLGLPGEAD